MKRESTFEVFKRHGSSRRNYVASAKLRLALTTTFRPVQRRCSATGGHRCVHREDARLQDTRKQNYQTSGRTDRPRVPCTT
jgi:hypothetical protein